MLTGQKTSKNFFRLERRYSFQKFTELLMAQSGGVFEASSFARPCEVSRGTISNYLSVLEATFVVHVIRPFSSRRATEIVTAPKVYGFDTGFVCYYRGLVAACDRRTSVCCGNTLFSTRLWHTHNPVRFITGGTNADWKSIFVLTRTRNAPIAIECKWAASGFSPAAPYSRSVDSTQMA